jgi:hypothetical protein
MNDGSPTFAPGARAPRVLGAALLALVTAAACTSRPEAQEMDDAQQHNTLTAEERAAGWRLLFDGESLEHWRGYGRDDMPYGWRAVDGALTRVDSGGDIVTREQFGDFELSLDWMVRERGNSGIFFRGVETDGPIYMTAPEMQILDDERHPDGQSELTSAGANYGLHPAPRGVVHAAGDWNTARVLVRGNHVEHWLNGRKIVEYTLHSDEWKALVAGSKFADWPRYGQAARGHIGLQDHGDWVAFRNIKLRELR